MKKLFPLLLLVALIFSCKKEKEQEKSPGCSTSVASISGSYKFTAYMYKASAASTEEDYFKILFPDSCERDDILTFTANGSWTKADAGIVCSIPGNDAGNWSLSGNAINLNGRPVAIESFDCKKLILVNNDVMQPGDKLKIILARQ